MPTYEYICLKCDHHFEKFQPITERPLSTCPRDLCRQKKWGKGKVKKAIVSGAGLIFKGSGFYITDYRSENYKESAKKESAANAPKETSDSKKSPAPAETKAAAAPSPTPAKPASDTGKSKAK